ncbi:unnamed protein product [Darwinula stevensoni]|uniref:CARD domain-containing protein n=1 Tax=Darwinula stevensoni TaxID=69355 RepID=A0A7R8XAY0_9CRUS|nr:unnamed protein product [Darwinula stevensoni]CAG0890493.1 unnamed protein product [Darwinula stevensoni]
MGSSLGMTIEDAGANEIERLQEWRNDVIGSRRRLPDITYSIISYSKFILRFGFIMALILSLIVFSMYNVVPTEYWTKVPSSSLMRYHSEPNVDYRGEMQPYHFWLCFRSLYQNISEDLKTWDNIRTNRRTLRDEYNVDGDELLRSLSDKKVFTADEEKHIRSRGSSRERYDELFQQLFHKNPKIYVLVFLEALTAIGRQDARDFLLSL